MQNSPAPAGAETFFAHLSRNRLDTSPTLLLVILLLCYPATGILAKGEATDVYFVPGDAEAQVRYTAAGNDYLWGLGSNGRGTGGNRLMTGFSLDNGATRYQYLEEADRVEVVRRDGATSCGLFVETTGSSRAYLADFPGGPRGTGCDMAAVMAGRVINVGVLDLFNNVGAGGKDVERVDFIFGDGIRVVQPADSGHVVTEKSGNNNVKIGAILALDSSGKPASYGPLVEVHAHAGTPIIGCPDAVNDICYGILPGTRNYEFLHTVDAATPPTLIGSGSEPLGLAFISQADLGLSTGQVYYGFSYFASDVDAALHDLVDPSTFPTDTNRVNRGPGDADIFGGTAGYFVLDALLNDISGTVMDDTGGGIPAVTVRLYYDNGDTVGRYDTNDSLVWTTETDSNGAYRFSRVLAGDYIIQVDRADPELTVPGYTAAMHNLSITLGRSNLTAQPFSFALPQISGSIFIDADGNGIPGAGEGVRGVVVRLYRDMALRDQVGEFFTGSDGAFVMDGIPNGTYYLYVEQAGSRELDRFVPGSDNPLQISVQGGNDVTVVLPFTAQPLPTRVLSGTLFLDVNGDGRREGDDEAGAGGVAVILYDGIMGQRGSTTTDAEGGFVFNVSAGNYLLQVDPADVPAGYALPRAYGSLPVSLDGNRYLPIPLGPDGDGDGVVEWEDLDDDNDGIPDAAEQRAGADVDSDSDGVVDRLDLDSDNDGVLDAVESGAGAVVLRDGHVAGDAGPNGLPDAVEKGDESGMVSYVSPVDTDGDGVEDFRDLDSDNDGITDVIEAGGVDEEPDGRLGNAASPQVDGWGLYVGGIIVQLRDSDGDGQPDLLELDSDADGIDDIVEAGYEDRDGDGRVDDFADPERDGAGNPAGFASFAMLPDEDADGVLDYQEKAVPPRLETGLEGMGCTLGNGHSPDPVLPLLMLFSLLYLLQNRSGSKHLCNSGRLSRGPVLGLLAALFLMMFLPGLAGAAERFQGRWYTGLGIGISELRPDPDTTVYINEETRSRGGKLVIGYGWSKRFSVEGYYAYLGKAKIGSVDPAVTGGELEYRDYGLSGLYYLFKQYETHRGLGIFARIGVGKMENRTELPYRRLNDNHLLLGFGFEYGFGKGLALRSGLDRYDSDSRLFTLSLLKRFGESGAEGSASAPVSTPGPVVSAPAGAVSPPESPSSALSVEKVRLGELGTVYFASSSAELNGEAYAVLDDVVTQLRRVPGATIDVEGHTDSRGSDAFNLALSEKRVTAVIDYLVSRGIAGSRLMKKPYGERRPVADNGTPEGRRLNRRVEFHERAR